MNGAAIAVSETFRTSKNRSFVVDSAGRILQKTENGGTQHYFYANDKPVGSSGALAAADFDYNYTPVTDQYPALTPGNYVVSAGDTLRGIALAVYGDAQLWYLIADANGLQTDAELTVGRNLTISNKVTNLRNAYDTYKPYEPGKIIGDLTPTLPEPPPPPAKKGGGGGCGGIGRILVAVVAIVVSVFTVGLALTAMAPAGSALAGMSAWAAGTGALTGTIAVGTTAGLTTGMMVGAAMIGGAVSSVVSQGVGIALGVQDKFSWGNVALAAIGAGVSAGLAAPSSPLSGSGPGMTIARAMVGNVISQGVSVAVGLQDKFDWKGVAAAGIGAGVSVGLGQILPAAGQGNTFGSLMRDTAIGFAGGVAKQAVYGGKINFANVAADAFGNALGNSLAYSAAAGNSAAQQASALDNAEAEAWSGSGLKLGSGLGLKAPEGLAADWGAPTSSDSAALLERRFALPSDVSNARQMDDLTAVVEAMNEYQEGLQDRAQLAAADSVTGIGRIFLPDAIAKWRDAATSLHEFLVGAKDAALDVYNAKIAEFRDRLIDIAASDPSMVTDFAVRLATKANDLLGKDGVLNPVEIAATPVLTASGIVSAVAQVTELPDIIDKLRGYGEDQLHVGNAAIRKILGEATELALKVERTGEGVVANYLRRLGRVGQDFFKNYAAGAGAELAVKAVFHASGLFEGVPVTNLHAIGDRGFFDLKNHSDNGIDILVKEKYGPNAGKHVAFEVKASINGTAPSLRGDQRFGADFFVGNRLERMARGRDPFTPGRVLPEVGDAARAILRVQDKFDGYVIKVTNFGKPNVYVDMMNKWVRVGSR